MSDVVESALASMRTFLDGLLEAASDADYAYEEKADNGAFLRFGKKVAGWQFDGTFASLYDEIDAALRDGGSSPAPRPEAGIAGGVRVKPLEWHRVTYGWLAFEEWYRIEDNGPNWSTDRYWLVERGERLGKFDTPEAAQAAMQVRHEARILAALAASPAATRGMVEITTNGTTRLIPEDEPVFLIRGQDIVGGAAVRAWADMAERVGASPDAVSSAREHATKMEAWPKKKVADLPQQEEDR